MKEILLSLKQGTLQFRGPRKNNSIEDRIADISGVINEMDLQILVVVEGPNRVEELQLFFDRPEINGDWKCAVQQSGAQSVGLAIRTDTGVFQYPPFSQFDSSLADQAPLLKEVTDHFLMDTDRDDLDELHKFERRPLYTEVHLDNGESFRILGVHLKSKGIFSALEWAAWWAKAEGNRKKILAQCYQLRSKFLDAYLAENATRDIPLIVCGDINDGPGFDASEMKLMASGVINGLYLETSSNHGKCSIRWIDRKGSKLPGFRRFVHGQFSRSHHRRFIHASLD